MELYAQVYTPTYVPRPSGDKCTIRLGNHFPDSNHVSPCVNFYADIFSEIGGITTSPHTAGQAQHSERVGWDALAKVGISIFTTKVVSYQRPVWCVILS